MEIELRAEIKDSEMIRRQEMTESQAFMICRIRAHSRMDGSMWLLTELVDMGS